VEAPAHEHDWLALTDEVLPVAAVYEWSVLPSCGAVVLFSGTARDHADGRDGVEELVYEAYAEQVTPRLAAIAGQIRAQWPTVGRIALLHRVGALAIGESSVIVAVSSPHRPEAFEAARFGIDTLKATVPIWKKERWRDGEDWALGAQHVTTIDRTGAQQVAPLAVPEPAEG
jgi:molybdopterin synthase catalytic subunit